VPIRNGVPDTLRLGLTGQLAHQFQCKGDGTAQPIAGGDVAIHHDLFIVDDGTGQLILEASVGGGVPALQQAKRGQDAGGAQMAATFRPAFAKAAQVSVTFLLAARLGVPGIPPGKTTMSTSE